MKKTMKLLSLVLSLGLLVGCGGNNVTPEDSSNQGGDESSEQGQSQNSSQGGASSQQGGGSGFTPVAHTHSFATTWTKDAISHWHKCNGVGCNERQDEADHTWDTGTVKTAAGEYTQGKMEYACTVCGQKKTVDIPATGGQETQGNFTFDDTALAATQEIHTTNQKKYLSLNKEYYHITESDLSGCGATGRSNVSTPNKVSVSWTYTAPEGKTLSKFQFVYGQKADLGDAYLIEGSTTQKAEFYNPYLGDNYFKVIAVLSDGSKEASPIKTFKVDETAPRNLSAGNMPNVRDMGGRTTYAGGKIKQGLIYRGAGNKFDNSSQVNTECQNVLTKQLKIKTEINVANGTGNNLNFNGVQLVNAFMDYGATPYSNLARNAERVRQVMDTLADESNYPVFYHCRIGTDRTGITGMMIGGLLGIPFNEVFQDYCFSNFAPIDGMRYPNKPSDPNGDDPAKYIDEILAMPGKTYQEQTYNALLSIGVPAKTLNKVIDIMTEGTKATIPAANVGTGTQLETDATRKAGSDYKDPAAYIELTNGKTVSYKATVTAGEKDVVIYLGSQDSSDSTKLANGLKLLIDGEEKTIVDKTYFKAGFGTTQQNRRTGYMFNLLGKYNLTEGEHTFQIVGKSSTTFNFATIAVFDHVTAA